MPAPELLPLRFLKSIREVVAAVMPRFAFCPPCPDLSSSLGEIDMRMVFDDQLNDYICQGDVIPWSV